jgi:hypothetical protein
MNGHASSITLIPTASQFIYLSRLTNMILQDCLAMLYADPRTFLKLIPFHLFAVTKLDSTPARHA